MKLVGENEVKVQLGYSVGLQGPPGEKGEPGATGPRGPQGPQGESYNLTEADKKEIAKNLINDTSASDETSYSSKKVEARLSEVTENVDATKLNGKDAKYYSHPRNLLSNSNFRIAQNGYGGAHGSTKYAADRWTFVGTSVEQLSALGGIRVYGSQWSAKVRQFIPDPTAYVGKTLTFAARMRSNNLTQGYMAIFPMTESGAYVDGYVTTWQTISTEWKIITISCTIPDGAVKICVAFDNPVTGSSTSDSYEIEWTELYEGKYTADNLPPYVPKGYAVELAECRMYYKKITAYTLVFGTYLYSTYARFVLPFEKMRITSPTPSIGSICEYLPPGGEWTAFTPSDIYISGDSVAITHSSAQSSTPGYSCFLRVEIILDADLK